MLNLVNVVKDVVSENVVINRKLDDLIEGKLRLCHSKDIDRAVSRSTQADLSDGVLTIPNCDNSAVTCMSGLGIKSTELNKAPLNLPNLDLDIGLDSNKQIIYEEVSPKPVVNDWHKVKSKKKDRNQANIVSLTKDNIIQPSNHTYANRLKSLDSNSLRLKQSGSRSNPTVTQVTDSRQRSTLPSGRFVVGTSENTSNISAAEKRAWFYLGRVKSGTSVDAIKELLISKLPGISPTVEKLESKGINASFKISVEFERKDELMDGSIWPKNVLVKRFLFKMMNKKPSG